MRIGITLCIDPPAEGVGCVPVGRGGDAVVSTCMRHTSIRQLRASGVYLSPNVEGGLKTSGTRAVLRPADEAREEHTDTFEVAIDGSSQQRRPIFFVRLVVRHS